MARRRTVSALVCVAALAACSSAVDPEAPKPDTGECEAPVPSMLTEQAGARELRRVATRDEIPGLADQSTQLGRALSTMIAYQGRVHLGYGDYSANTGPIEMVSFDPQLDDFVEHGSISTEDAQYFAIFDDMLFASDVDPRGHEAIGSVFRLLDGCDTWETMTPVPGAVHNYGMAEFEGRLWLTTGSLEGTPARVMSTDDGGESWREELVVYPEDGPGHFVRILHAGSTPDTLVTTGRLMPGTQSFAHTYSGGDWTELDAVPSSHDLVPLVLGPRLVLAVFDQNVGKGGVALEGHAIEDGGLVPVELLPGSRSLINWSRDDTVERLWALARTAGGEHQVLSSWDLVSWEVVAKLAPSLEDPRSIAHRGNSLFIGTGSGELYILDALFVPAKN